MSVEDGDAGAVPLCHVDRAAYGHVAGFENPEVPACSPGRSHPGTDVVATREHVELEARPAGLRHLERGCAPLPDITDANVPLQDTERAQVLPERSVAGQSAEFIRPCREVLGGVRVDSLVGPTMDVEVGLAVACEIEPGKPQPSFPGDRLLADPAPDPLALHLAKERRRAHVHGRNDR